MRKSYISSFGWRGKLFFVSTFVLMPMVLFTSIATYKFSGLSQFALILSVVFTIPLRFLKREIAQETNRIEAQKVKEYEELRNQRHIADLIAEKAVEEVINEGLEFAVDLVAGMFGVDAGGKKFSFKKMNLEEIRLLSYADAKRTVLARRQKKLITTKELVFGAVFLLLCQMLSYGIDAILNS